MMDEGRAFLDGGVSPPDTQIGRPSPYGEETRKNILDAVAEGVPLKALEKLPGFPGRTTLFRWLASDETFASEYANARDWRFQILIDEILQIADDGSKDFIEEPDDEGGLPVLRLNKEWLGRSKHRTDVRFRILAAELPKKYGKHAGEPMLIAPPAQPGQSLPGDNAKLIGQSITIDNDPMNESIEAFQAEVARLESVSRKRR